MPSLFPTFAVPKVVGEEKKPENRMKGSLYFDFAKGDFLLNSEGNIESATPYEAWCQWCMKTVYTQRFAFLGYSGQVGTELEEALNETTKKAQESALIRTITEALLADPYSRTKRVYSFLFQWGTDSLEVTFTVMGVWDKDATMTAKFLKGGIYYGGYQET